MLLYGTDPEFFIVDKDENVVSPALLEIDYGLKPIIDNEKHPIYILNTGKNYSWMMDGAAIELTILKPLETPEEMYSIVNWSLDELGELANSFNLSVYKKPVVKINLETYLSRLDVEKIYQGFISGCDPDEDAILNDYQCSTQDISKNEIRCGGGHFHLSGNRLFRFFIPTVKFLAITMGNYFIANSPYPELEKQRALTYGKPGRYRQQVYKNGDIGVEYRTPSNSWLSFSLDGYREMFEMAKLTEYFLEKERSDIIDRFLESTVNAIVNADRKLSLENLEEVYKLI